MYMRLQWRIRKNSITFSIFHLSRAKSPYCIVLTYAYCHWLPQKQQKEAIIKPAAAADAAAVAAADAAAGDAAAAAAWNLRDHSNIK